MAFQLSKNILW